MKWRLKSQRNKPGSEQEEAQQICISHGIKIGGRLISNLRYTDDTALYADNHKEICKLLNSINEEGKLKNMKINAKKNKVMYIGKGQYKDIKIDDVTLERVSEFIYLGSNKKAMGTINLTFPNEQVWLKER